MEGVSALVDNKRRINVSATCVDQSLHVFLGNEPIQDIDFGSLYHGQSKVITVQLVNDGPTSCNYNAQISDDRAGAADATQRGSIGSVPSETTTKAESPLTIRPFQGTVPAFGKIPLDLTF